MHLRQVAMPNLVSVFGQLDARRLALAGLIEETEFDPGRVG